MVEIKISKNLEDILRYQRNDLKLLNEKLNNYLRFSIEDLYSKEENVFEANDYLFGNNLGEGTTFGVTFIYGGKIILLDRLKGEDRKTVLLHEKHHRNNTADSEIMTREKTATTYWNPNPNVSGMSNYN